MIVPFELLLCQFTFLSPEFPSRLAGFSSILVLARHVSTLRLRDFSQLALR
jgi:hypothetical protein